MAKVFISYAHDGRRQRVLDLRDRLRAEGVDVSMDDDLLPCGPPEGWPAWSEKEIRSAEVILVFCSEKYTNNVQSASTSEGLGAAWEAGAIQAELYRRRGDASKFRVVVLDAEDRAHIPTWLQQYQYFAIGEPSGFDALLASLRPGTIVDARTQSMDWPASAEDFCWPLADRKEVFSSVRDALAGQSLQRVFLVCGPPGTGKTASAGALAQYAARVGLPACLFNFRHCPTPEEFIAAMRLDFGDHVLVRASQAADARLFAVISDFQHLRAPAVLILDTYEQAPRAVKVWLEEQLLPRIDTCKKIIVIVCGQAIPGLTGQGWEAASCIYSFEAITRLEDWAEYCAVKWRKAVPQGDLKTLTLATAGNPAQLSRLLATFVPQLGGPVD